MGPELVKGSYSGFLYMEFILPLIVLFAEVANDLLTNKWDFRSEILGTFSGSSYSIRELIYAVGAVMIYITHLAALPVLFVESWLFIYYGDITIYSKVPYMMHQWAEWGKRFEESFELNRKMDERDIHLRALGYTEQADAEKKVREKLSHIYKYGRLGSFFRRAPRKGELELWVD